MKTQFNSFASLAAFVLALCISSCSSNSITPTATQGVHALKTGDSFTYHEYNADTSGVKDPGSDTTLTAIVTRTSIAVAGKSKVSEIVKGPDTVYYADASDSSFSLLQNQVGIVSGASIPAMWISFDPAKSGKIQYDSTQNATISGMPAKIHAKVVTNYLGKDAVTIGSNALTIYKFSKIVTVIVTVFGQDFTTLVTLTNNYAPSIGYLTLHDAKTISDSNNSPVPNGITYSLLQSYSLH